jgi:hypothetical protein
MHHVMSSLMSALRPRADIVRHGRDVRYMPYSITSSALASSDFGTLRPSVWSVLAPANWLASRPSGCDNGAPDWIAANWSNPAGAVESRRSPAWLQSWTSPVMLHFCLPQSRLSNRHSATFASPSALRGRISHSRYPHCVPPS